MNDEARSVEAWKMLHSRGYFLKHPHYRGLPLDGGSTIRELSQIGLNRTDVVLDVGCGYGRVTIPLAPLVSRVIGIDLHEGPLSRGRETARKLELSNVEFLLCDGWSFPILDDSVDVVFSVNVIQHCRRETVGRYVDESLRVLQFGGAAAHQFLIMDTKIRDIDPLLMEEQSVGWTMREILDMVQPKTKEFLIDRAKGGTSAILRLYKTE